MSGPIVRTGTTPKFWENWERAFGEKKATKKKSAAKAVKKTARKTAKKAKKKKK